MAAEKLLADRGHIFKADVVEHCGEDSGERTWFKVSGMLAFKLKATDKDLFDESDQFEMRDEWIYVREDQLPPLQISREEVRARLGL